MRTTNFIGMGLLCLVAVACGTSETSTSNPAADGGTVDSGVLDSGDTPATDGGTDSGADKTGFETVVPWPGQGEQLKHLSMALDDAGDPMLAYMLMNKDQNDSVWFVRYSSKTKAWSAPVKVDDAVNIEENDPHRETSIAFDAATKQIGIAYSADRNPTSSSAYEVRFAVSNDGGQTFAKEPVSIYKDPPAYSEDAYNASLAMRDGKAYVVYTQRWQLCQSGRCDGGYFAERAAGGGWTRTPLAIPGGAEDIRSMPTAIALDSAGNPGIAYWVRGLAAGGYETRLMFAKPKAGGAPSEAVLETLVQNDVVSVDVTYDGAKALVAAHLKSVADATYDLQFAEGDIGAWTKSTLPRSGADTTLHYQSVSVGNGEVVVGAEWGTATGKSNVPCGPKLLRRKSGASAFEVTCPDAAKLEGFAGENIEVAHRPNGKLVMAIIVAQTDKDNVARGIVVWREP